MRNLIVRATILFAVLSFLGVLPAYAGPALDMTGKRTVRLSGEIGGGNAIDVANRVERLSAESKKPINIIINSPGGSVAAGMQIVQAISIAKSRGVTVRCAVTVLAASMAFTVLNECSERYALSNSLLLFHPARAMVVFAAVKAEEATYMGEQLAAINNELLDKLEGSFGVVTNQQKTWLEYHFNNETLWPASRLVKEIPRKQWLSVVDDIHAEGSLFGNPSEEGAVAVKNFLQERGVQ
jgi:ATP-dependent protease ClpP protease subunit